MSSGDYLYDFTEDDRALHDAQIKVRDRDKPKDADPLPSGFTSAGFAAMTSYIVDGKTEGLVNATEIKLSDIYSAPYVMPAEAQVLKDAKPLVYPQKGESLLYCKPSSSSSELPIDDSYIERGRTREASAVRLRSQSLVTYHKIPDKVPVGSLTKEFVKTAFEHVAMRQPKDLGPDQVYRPSVEEMFAEYHRFTSVRPHMLGKDGYMSKNKAQILRFWFRWHRGWLLTQKDVENLVLPKFRLVPTGLIPCKAYGAEQAAYLNDVQTYLENLSNSKKKPKKAKPDAEERKKAKVAARRRIVGPVKNVSVIGKPDEFKQNDDDTVYFDVRQDPYVKSVIRITHRFNYLDDKTPDKQPSVRATVELTHRNTTKAKGGDYQPTHHVIDVTNPIWQTALSKIFPQTKTEDDNDYLDDLYKSVDEGDQSLMLVIFQHNEHPCTENVLTRNEDIPDLLKDLRIAIGKSPSVFTLIRGTDVKKLISEIVGRWHDLTRYDPLNEFFVDIENPYINDKGIKAKGYPLFKTPARFAFEDWSELARAVGIGALMEQRAFMGKHAYDAKVAVVPVPGTLNKLLEFYNALHLQATVKYDGKNPRLVPGDAVQIGWHEKGDTAPENAWKGTVTEATAATSMNMINISVERPWKDTTPLDKEKRSVLDEEHLKKMSAMQLETWARNNCTIPIRIYTRNEEKECKRLMSNIANMKVPSKLRQAYIEKDKRLVEARELLLCKDHTKFQGRPLYEDVHPSDLEQALHIINQMLLPHQMEQHQKWMDSGVYANTSWLSGPSGSGKSFLAYVSVLPYLLRLRVSNRVIATQKHEASVAFQDQTDSPVDAEDFDAGEDTFTTENGRITYCAMQNDAVDEVYRNLAGTARSFMQRMRKSPVLVLRLHSKNAELNAVKAMVRPSYSRTEEAGLFNIDPHSRVTDELPLSLLNAYLAKFRGSGNPNIRDKRMKELDGSAAKYILELARFPGFPLSPEIRATFTTDELEALKTQLKPIVDARSQLKMNKEDLTKDLAQTIKKAAVIGMDALLQKAAIVCTTTAVATEYAFNLKRRAHVIVLEEAGRANDAETFGFFSHHWSSKWRLVVGAINQLPPQAYGNSNDNAFQRQIMVSTIMRYCATGGPVAMLSLSSRFQNKQLMDLAASVNNMPDLKPIREYDSDATKTFADINFSIWGIDTPLLFLNVEEENPQQDANRSTYNLETAAATMRDAVLRMKHMQGRDHTIITPYNAQVMVLKRERDFAVKAALSRGDKESATQLTNVTITTVDSFMGKDNLSVTLDTAGAIGHLFQTGRTVVACTRAKISFQVVGPSEEFTQPTIGIKRSSGLIRLIYDLSKAKCIRTINRHELRTYEQYRPALESLGLCSSDGEVMPSNVITEAQLISAATHEKQQYGEEEIEILSLMKKTIAFDELPGQPRLETDNNTGSATDWNVNNASSATDWNVNNAGSATDWDANNAGGATDWDVNNAGSATDWDVNNASSATDWNHGNAGDADVSNSQQPEDEYTVADFEGFPPGIPYQDVDDARLAFNVFKSIKEGIIEKHVVDSVKSAIYRSASPQRRVQLAHLVNQGGVSVKVADEVLDARGDLATAYTYVKVFRAIIEDPIEDSRTWQEYLSEIGEIELPEGLKDITSSDKPHDPYDQTYADDSEEADTVNDPENSDAHDKDFDS